jgi:hypothetical protein
VPSFPGRGFGLIPAPGSFTSSAFSVPPGEWRGPSQNAAARLGSKSPRFRVPRKMGDPEKRQVRGIGANFTVLSVATQQSWKDANDEWQSKTEWHRVVVIWNQA